MRAGTTRYRCVSPGEQAVTERAQPLPYRPALENVRAGLAARGFDLDRFAARMRSSGAQADETAQIPDTLLQAGEVRTLNLNLVPAVHGGCPAIQSLASRAVLMTYLAHADASLALALPGPGLAMPPVNALASVAQQTAFFHRFHSDVPRWGAFAITEPDSGSDAAAMRTTARKTGHGWILNGTKCFITNGARADCVITFATVNRQQGRFGVRAFLVPGNTPGLGIARIERMAGLRASQLAVLSYADCEVPEDALLRRGDEHPLDDAFSGAQRSWDYFRPLLSSIMIGTCLRVRDELAAFFEAGGLPVNARLGVTSVDDCLLDIDRRITAAHLLCQYTAWKVDCQVATPTDASMAKAYTSRVASHITREALELAGLEGIAAHPALEQGYRDAKAYDIMEGTGELQRLMIARATQRTPSLPWEIVPIQLPAAPVAPAP